MTDDNWETVKLAIGFVNGTYSVNAEVIAGTLLAGENLTISNTGGTFTVDGKGATMTNGSISTQLKDSNGNLASEIVLSPEQGFSISNIKSEGEDKRVFYADTQGNLHFKGNLIGATGSFSGDISGGSIYIPNKTNANFSVDKNGYMTCKGANIGGTLNAVDGIFTGTLRGVDGDFSGTISANQVKGGVLSGTSINIGNGNFTVDSSGDLIANNGTFRGTLSGQIETGESIAANGGVSFTGNVGINMIPGGLANGLSVAGWNGSSNYCIYAQDGIYSDKNIRGVGLIGSDFIELNGNRIYSWDGLVTTESVQLALMNIGGYGNTSFAYNDVGDGRNYRMYVRYGLITGWTEI